MPIFLKKKLHFIILKGRITPHNGRAHYIMLAEL